MKTKSVSLVYTLYMRPIEEILALPVGELTTEEVGAGRRYAGEEHTRLLEKEKELAAEADRRWLAARAERLSGV